MNIYITVKTNAKENKVNKIDENCFKVLVKSSPEKGKANKEVLKLLGKYFKVNSSSLRISSGKSKRKKIIKLEE